VAADSPPTGPDESTGADNAPEILERLVRQAEGVSASDIHIQMLGQSAAVSFRLDGVMNPVTTLPAPVAERVVGRIKFLARLKTYQDSLPQDGRIDKADLGAGTDLRVSTYPTVTGEKVVLRLFHSLGIVSMAELGFPSEVRAELLSFLRQNTGMLLLTGPAGSGKTTTIYACLKELAAQGGRHVITVEDPAEQIVPGIMQTEVNEARGLDFAKAARHLLRQDPQVLMIGEIRDDETARIAMRASLTGHLVITTLHAGSCKGVFERLAVLCPEQASVLHGIDLVLNQRLLRRFCTECGGKGCRDCLGTGYHGRIPAVEFVRLNETLRAALIDRNFNAVVPRPTLAEAGAALVGTGLTSSTEVQRVLGLA
jgi:general secretion pathway protein E